MHSYLRHVVLLSLGIISVVSFANAEPAAAGSTSTPSAAPIVPKRESEVVVFLKKSVVDMKLTPTQKTAIQSALKAFQENDEKARVRRERVIKENEGSLTSVQRMQSTVEYIDTNAKDTHAAFNEYKKFYATLDAEQKKSIDLAFSGLRQKQSQRFRRDAAQPVPAANPNTMPR